MLHANLVPIGRSIGEGRRPLPLYMHAQLISPRANPKVVDVERMGRPGGDRRCKRHPKHREKAGVCPFCLREKLSYLLSHTSASSSAASYLSSSSSSLSSLSYSSSDDDSEGGAFSYAPSPPRRRASAGGKLRKSQSLIVFANRSQRKEKEEEEKKKKKKKKEEARKGKEEVEKKKGEARKGKEEVEKKKGRFWSKLFTSRGKSRRSEREEKGGGGELLHSQTFKEKPSAKWI